MLGTMARTILCLLLVIFTGNLYSQNFRNSQELFLEAEYFLMFEDYNDALLIYKKLSADYPDNFNIIHRIGLCYLNIPGQKDKAINYLELAAAASAASYREGSLKQKTAPYSAWFDLATAYRVNYQFESAKGAFRRYFETLLPDDFENRHFIEHQIQVCDNAAKLIEDPIEFKIENLGEQFNDNNANFYPVFSNNQDVMVFMSSLKFYDAVFFAKKIKNHWAGPINITPEIQSDGDLYVSCLADNGSSLYFSKVIDEKSDLYKSEYNGTRWLPAKKLNNIINSIYWDSHAFIFDKGNKMIFASDRPGGEGGLDLYISELDAKGNWGIPVNLGPKINTPFNEDRPFVSESGKKLFFCSQGHKNMGGFDIFSATGENSKDWSKVLNLGYPMNTPDDDTFFMPVNEGRNGYISANREKDGFGKEDIYYITFK